MFSDNTQLIVPNLLAGDLEGKGFLKIQRPDPAEASKKQVKPPIWEAVSEGFGKLMVVNKIDSSKDRFASLVNRKGQLTQATARSCKFNINFGNEFMKRVGQAVVEKKIDKKEDVVKIRDELRKELEPELAKIQMPSEVEIIKLKVLTDEQMEAALATARGPQKPTLVVNVEEEAGSANAGKKSVSDGGAGAKVEQASASSGSAGAENQPPLKKQRFKSLQLYQDLTQALLT